MEKSINVAQLKGIRRLISQTSNLGDDYVFSHVTAFNREILGNSGPIRVNGITWMLCVKGSITVEVNLTECILQANTLMVTGPDSIVEIKNVGDEEIDLYLFFVSPEFMRNTNIDPNVLNSMPMSHPSRRHPDFKITDDETVLLRRYFDLVHESTMGNVDDIYVRSIARCLVSAIVYQVLQFASRRVKIDEPLRSTSRRSTYVNDFWQLVHAHHTRERSVAFYASKLFISPKYLSLIIKEATGRSAAEWIDEFVILEAKNLLRFSGLNIQQVAYKLNFPNQSSFGKYFKHLTGMSPSQYQRT